MKINESKILIQSVYTIFCKCLWSLSI